MNEKTRILVLLEATLGGTRKHVVDLLKGIDLNEFDVTFGYGLSRADDNFLEDLEEIKASGIHCVFIPMVREISPIKDLTAFLACCRLIFRGKFDLVHTHSSKAGFLGRLATKLVSPSTPTIYTPNSLAVNLNPIYRYLERFAGYFTDRVIAVSDSEKREILSTKIVGEKKVEVIPSGVETSIPFCNSTLRDEIGVSHDTVVAVSVGRLTRQKDPMTFFRAAEMVLRKCKQIHFVWVGDGELRQEVSHFIEEAGIGDRVTLLGWRTDITQLLAGADIFLLTSLYESFGYVTCEAMACSLPVVVSNVTGSCDLVIHEETGFLVEAMDVEDFATHTIRLAEDAALRKSMGRRGLQLAREKFSLESMNRKTTVLYRQLAAREFTSPYIGLLEKDPA